jgi:hypothetical protein
VFLGDMRPRATTCPGYDEPCSGERAGMLGFFLRVAAWSLDVSASQLKVAAVRTLQRVRTGR